jgi:hypothetical protein
VLLNNRTISGASTVVVTGLRPGLRVVVDDGNDTHEIAWPELQTSGWYYFENADRYRRINGKGWARTCTPDEVVVEPMGVVLGTIGPVEMETVAAAFVLYHQENDLSEWSDVRFHEFSSWLFESETIKRLMQNPVWRLDLGRFVQAGWILGWKLAPGKAELQGNTVGRACLAFIERMATPHTGGFPRIQRLLSPGVKY